MDLYASRLGLRGRGRAEFLYLIREMDNAFLLYQSEQFEKSRPGGGPIGGE